MELQIRIKRRKVYLVTLDYNKPLPKLVIAEWEHASRRMRLHVAILKQRPSVVVVSRLNGVTHAGSKIPAAIYSSP